MQLEIRIHEITLDEPTGQFDKDLYDKVGLYKVDFRDGSSSNLIYRTATGTNYIGLWDSVLPTIEVAPSPSTTNIDDILKVIAAVQDPTTVKEFVR